MVSVSDEMLVADPIDGDRRERRAATSRDPQPLPAAATRGRWSETVVEDPGLCGLGRPDDRAQRNRSHADCAATCRRRRSEHLLEAGQASSLAAEQPARSSVATASAPLASECGLGVDEKIAGFHSVEYAAKAAVLHRAFAATLAA
jgi:hypothetical protein